MSRAVSRSTAGIAVLALVLGCAGVGAQVGHAQGAAAKGASPVPSGDAAVRHADGSVYLSKPVQRLLGIRTLVAQEGEHEAALELAGRVVADPNDTARIQAARDGVIQPGEKGLPFIGQRVEKDQVLATLVAMLTPAEDSQLRQKLVEIERELALLLPRAEHASIVNPNMPMGDSAVALLQELQIQSQAMVRQAELVKAALNARVEIKAPIAGVISAVNLGLGQMVAARDTLVEIAGDGPPRIEAFGFGTLPARVVLASARTGDGRGIALTYLGRGPVLRGNAVPMLFRATAAVPGAEIGRPLRVFVGNGSKQRGALLPRTALRQVAVGNASVWEHTDAERFVARAVTIVPYDASQILVTGGLMSGARIVVDGAALLSQIR